MFQKIQSNQNPVKGGLFGKKQSNEEEQEESSKNNNNQFGAFGAFGQPNLNQNPNEQQQGFKFGQPSGNFMGSIPDNLGPPPVDKLVPPPQGGFGSQPFNNNPAQGFFGQPQQQQFNQNVQKQVKNKNSNKEGDKMKKMFINQLNIMQKAMDSMRQMLPLINFDDFDEAEKTQIQNFGSNNNNIFSQNQQNNDDEQQQEQKKPEEQPPQQKQILQCDQTGQKFSIPKTEANVFTAKPTGFGQQQQPGFNFGGQNNFNNGFAQQPPTGFGFGQQSQQQSKPFGFGFGQQQNNENAFGFGQQKNTMTVAITVPEKDTKSVISVLIKDSDKPFKLDNIIDRIYNLYLEQFGAEIEDEKLLDQDNLKFTLKYRDENVSEDEKIQTILENTDSADLIVEFK